MSSWAAVRTRLAPLTFRIRFPFRLRIPQANRPFVPAVRPLSAPSSTSQERVPSLNTCGCSGGILFFSHQTGVPARSKNTA